MKPRRTAVIVFAALALFATAPAAAQMSAYRFKAANVPVGKVFHYTKSNLDGTHATLISIFVPATDRIEALKWDKGGSEATLVQAKMDWSKFSVCRFDGWRLSRDSVPEPRVTLDVQGDMLSMSLMEKPLQISHWPWHSYDFDFTSLSFTLPHLQNPEGTLAFWRTDFVYKEPPAVAELGEIHLRFEGRESRAGKSVRRYSIGGAGLQGSHGTWWADRRTGLLVEYEIPVGDEPGYDSVRLRLTGTEKMSAQRWEEFKRQAVGSR